MRELREIEFDAPQGRVRIDRENNHTFLWPRVARLDAARQFQIVWNPGRAGEARPLLRGPEPGRLVAPAFPGSRARCPQGRGRARMSITVLRDLRDLGCRSSIRPTQEGNNLVEHLRRIGCMVEATWPIPDTADGVGRADARHRLRAPGGDPRLLRSSRTRRRRSSPSSDTRTPRSLQIVLECGALAVTEKPVRPFGLLTQLILARTLWLERQRGGAAVRKVEASSPASRRSSAPRRS